jgi:hypothetical protein
MTVIKTSISSAFPKTARRSLRKVRARTVMSAREANRWIEAINEATKGNQ